MVRHRHRAVFAALLLLAAMAPSTRTAAQEQDHFKFKSGIELVNVTATVTGPDGRFISGLHKEDFSIYDDDKQQEITHFSSERVPVSLGILIDASGSMADDKMSSARAALGHFVNDLLGDDDELFLMEFNDRPRMLQSWTTDRRVITSTVAHIAPFGGTALYDAIAEALPMAAQGKHEKKALLVITDGNDTESHTTIPELRQLIRQSEVLVYALGIDGVSRGGQSQQRPQNGRPRGIPFPGGGGRGGRFPPIFPQIIWGGSAGRGSSGAPRGTNSNDRVNVDALRQITDDTGGRSEIIYQLADLDGATSHIADELSKQYSIGYTSPGLRDGKWHSIRVEVKDRSATVRARKGYVSS
jgi:VWFA-related protein